MKQGQRVTGHITNRDLGRVDFTGTVTDVFQSNGQALVNVSCSDGIERTARLENVEPVKTNLTPNMIRTLGNLVRHGQVPGGLRAMNELGCTYPAMNALVRRGLAELKGTGEFLAYHPEVGTGTFEIRAYYPTAAGLAANEEASK
jgi:hypothetical protein